MKEKIQKSEALLDFIARRKNEVEKEWNSVKETKDIHFERTLHGKYFAFKEILDSIKNNYFNGKYNTIHPNQSSRRLFAINKHPEKRPENK